MHATYPARIRLISLIALSIVVPAFCAILAGAQSGSDPLPAWNGGPAKQAILDFVRTTTDKSSPQFVPPDQRIAVFDNDGTLWIEQPAYTQVMFAMDRVPALVEKQPELKEREPYKSILARDHQAMAKFTVQDIEKVVAATHSGMTVEQFKELVSQWLAQAKHPRFKRPYTELIYQPMLEIMQHLRANGYKTYIVTGGGQDFVRAFAQKTYGVPPEQVIGSAAKVKYEYGKDGEPVLVKLPEVLLIDDKTGKPEAINLIIGKRPVAAFGNSTGDQQMLEYTGAGAPGSARLMMLVHHDDTQREFEYGADSKIGTFSEELMSEARQRGWTVISMKNDWKRIFAFESGQSQ
ncbi:MAG: haloacid dehalogenase-like hydrolase [Phycisphaerales bacterium]|nr:haloacid dehalogenase-like hydrolase [Phycisphaerales bacterium]MCI0631384.1 haloacid dehalogenase-like hydrolase [Phycisphaerales bacterium]MCI0675330.1 haloacid dehalogenase-like hydrolase [Phycisphaerales bacterium]